MNTSKRIVIILGILLVAGFVAICLTGGREEPTFEPMDGQFALLDKAYLAWFGEKQDVTKIPAGTQVLCDWYRFKALMPGKREGWEDAAESFSADAMDMVMSSDIRSLYWAGEAAFDSLYAYYAGDERAKAKIAAQCPDDEAITRHLSEDRDDFLKLAQNEGLADSDGRLIAAKKKYVRLLHRRLWTTLAETMFPIERISPPEERVAFMRWQIEHSSMDLQKKLDKIYALENLNLTQNYDTAYAKGVLFYQNHMYGEACAAFRDGLARTPSENTFRIKRFKEAIRTISKTHPALCVETAVD